MDSVENRLLKLGFSEKEATVYILLLKYGSRQTSFVAKKAKLNRGTAYNTLHMLLERGLITKRLKGKTQFFAALDPENLLSYLTRKEEEFQQRKNMANEMLVELRAISLSDYSKPAVQYFSGVEGVKTALEDTLAAKEQTLRGYTSTEDLDNFIGADYFGREYTQQRIQRGYRLESIQSLEKDKVALTRDIYVISSGTSKESRREVRYIRNELAFPMSMRIYDDKVLVISSKEENFALITQSVQYAEMQKRSSMSCGVHFLPDERISCQQSKRYFKRCKHEDCVV